MCYFPTPNTDYDGIAYKHGITEFECGACPECLQKRSSAWALRCVYEAKAHAFNCMVTLTYDTFVRDKKGNIVKDRNGVPLENPVDPDLKVNKRDIQLFIKRLRKWYNQPIKYFCGAEYGSRTHRAHYHLILFGVRFPDIHYYKKSKRGNIIYMSNILTKLWNHGICTVDSINIHASIARYCSKYCAKSRSEDVFNLFSQSIGLSELLKSFNGFSYWIDGREYTVPRVVWQRVITDRYKNIVNFPFSYKYVNRDRDLGVQDFDYEKSVILRENYFTLRDSDIQYQGYLAYWKHKSSLFESIKPSVKQRIYSLPEDKYHFYKVAALRCLELRKYVFVQAPGSRAGFSYYVRNSFSHLPWSSRPNTASDTSPRTFLSSCIDDLVSLYESLYNLPIVGLPVSSCRSICYDSWRLHRDFELFCALKNPVSSSEFPLIHEQLSFNF